MLTKDLLRLRRRGQRIYPGFIDPQDGNLREGAEALIAVFEAAPGLEVTELDEALDGQIAGPKEVSDGLKKLLWDRCDMVEDDGSAEEFRWQVLETAESLRRTQDFVSKGEFEAALALSLGHDLSDLKSKLYADLPEHRRIIGFSSLTAEALLHRYNCALVQGLLLRSREITIKASQLTTVDKRRFFRALKFQRLLAVVNADSGASDLEIKLSGPLQLFDQAQNYGMRMALFFPYVLHLGAWQLKAEVKLRDRVEDLVLDQSCGIVSHYEQRDPHIPSEMTSCLSAFNEAHPGARAEPGAHFVNIGRESYCFPDIGVTFLDSERRVDIELFHRWHAGQLKGRLAALDKNAVKNLRVGVCKSLAKTPEMETILAGSSWFQENGFLFRDFPTPKHLWNAVERGS